MAKILIVDDEKGLASLFSVVLVKSSEGRHYTVGIDSGKKALKKLKRENFDLVITDLQMPKMNGLQLAKAIRKRGKSLVIVGMTGNIANFDAEELAKTFDAVWQKPISIEQLPKMVAKILAKG